MTVSFRPTLLGSTCAGGRRFSHTSRWHHFVRLRVVVAEATPIVLTRAHSMLRRTLCVLSLRCNGQILSQAMRLVPWGPFQVPETAL